jgi:hypothetical protein
MSDKNSKAICGSSGRLKVDLIFGTHCNSAGRFRFCVSKPKEWVLSFVKVVDRHLSVR